MTIDTQTRKDIILGAVTMTGPVADDAATWNAKLKANAKTLALMLNETSDVARSIEMLASCKVFTGTILHLLKEPKSNRAFIGLRTVESKFAPDGIENVRTEIVDWDSKSGEAYHFAKRLRGLTGHRVLLWVEMQETKSGQKVRILQHVEDLGPADGFDAEEGKALTLAKFNK